MRLLEFDNNYKIIARKKKYLCYNIVSSSSIIGLEKKTTKDE